MKTRIYTALTFTFMGLLCFSSCEMREEIKGNGTNENTEMGLLDLGISVKSKTQTKVGNDVSEFPVTISNKDGVVKEFVSYAALQEANPIRLEVGNYTLKAHTVGEIQPKMSYPYYLGDKEILIEKDVTTKDTVQCKMQNLKMQLVYDPEFLNTFSSWRIAFNDGTANILTFTSDDRTSSVIYWKVAPEVKTIVMNIEAVTKETGQTIHDTRSFSKADADNNPNYDGDTDFFGGGDFLDITMDITPEGATSSIGFDVTVKWSFVEREESIDIPVEEVTPPDPVEPSDPGEEGTGPSLVCDYFESGVQYSMESGVGDLSAITVLISAPKGLQSVNATILAGNGGFLEATEDMKFNTGRELVGDTELESLLAGFGMTLPMPKANAASYTFPIGEFFTLMNIYGPTVDVDETEFDPDGNESHVFKIKVIDNAGNTVEKTLVVTISK